MAVLIGEVVSFLQIQITGMGIHSKQELIQLTGEAGVVKVVISLYPGISAFKTV